MKQTIITVKNSSNRTFWTPAATAVALDHISKRLHQAYNVSRTEFKLVN